MALTFWTDNLISSCLFSAFFFCRKVCSSIVIFQKKKKCSQGLISILTCWSNILTQYPMENHKQLKLSLKMAIFIPPQYLLHCVDFGVFICCLSCHTVCVLCYCCQTCLVSFDYSVYNNNLHRITKYSHESVMVGEQRRTNCIGLLFHAFAVCIVFK